MQRSVFGALPLMCCIAVAATPAPGQEDGEQKSQAPFKIKVVDRETGRGVPLIELETVNHLIFLTDSAGVVAFNEPGMMGKDVYFSISGHGYEYPADGFGYRGVRLRTTAGDEAVVEVDRINLAERLYRVTGAGIYGHSVAVGDKPPTKQPVLNARVLGSDSVVNAIYRDRIYWFWGDTNRLRYPLGNFHVPGATSELPGQGGLDPAVGVDLEYFVGEQGFALETARMPGQGPTWIDGLTVLADEDGTERMFAKYVKVKAPLTIYERGLVEFDPAENRFRAVDKYDMDQPLYPRGHPLIYESEGIEYVYFCDPYALVRVPATVEALMDLDRYQAWTCLEATGQSDRFDVRRDADGNVDFQWITGGILFTPSIQKQLRDSGDLAEDEGLYRFANRVSGETVIAHRGTIQYNAFRSKFVMIFTESFGTSALGEVWYAEADQIEGPWTKATKIVTHDKYSFYNPKQHAFFDSDEGRFIYFEGTYTTLFSGNEHKTPRYDYNQIMYRLDLANPRLRE